MLKLSFAALALTTVFLSGPALAAAGEKKTGDAAQAAQARGKPLQRCDQLNDKAGLECLHKARERIVDARRKREASGKGEARALPARDEKAGTTKGASPAKANDAKK